VTIRDVAERAGVAVSTVSAVINSTAPTSDATRHRVEQAIVELGFEPDGNARNLRRQRAYAVGLMVPDVTNPFFILVARGVEDVLRDHDTMLVLCSTDFEPEREAHYARLLRARRLDGVIHDSGLGVVSTALRELAEANRVVLVDERIPGLELPFVGSDNRRAARIGANHVLDQGHRKVAVVSGPKALWTAEQRLAGYREALVAHGVNPDQVPVVAGDYREESGRAAAAKLLGVPESDRPTAILAANDLMAVGVLQYCLTNGIGVPEQVSIIGFDDIPISSLVSPGLTTMRQPAHEMGRTAAEILLSYLAGEEPVRSSVTLEATLVVRGTVASPPT
jgi:DNA-binding LacI/PurR family transcriptional regulator